MATVSSRARQTSEGEYDFWLVDLDGTLVDVEFEYSRQLFDRVSDRIGHEFSDTEIEILWNGLTGTRNRQLRAWDIEPETFWEALHEAEDPAARAEATYLHDDAAIIGELELPVGLITHCQSYLTDPVLESVGIREWFDAVLCCTEETGWKPDPDPVRRIMRSLGVTTADHRGLLVGDGPSDVGAAWNAGLDAAHVERIGPERRGQCVLGEYRVSRIDELLDGHATGR